MGIKNLEQKMEKFMGLATRLIDDSNRGDEDVSIKKKLSEFVAMNMAIGEQVTMKRHLAAGVIIGVASTTLAFGVYTKFKKRSNTDKKDVIIDLDNLEEMLHMHAEELKNDQVEG